MVSRIVVLLMLGSRFLGFYFLSSGLGPSYQGTLLPREKEFPPAMIDVVSSSSLTLTCSVAGSPAPTAAWYKDGQRLAGTKMEGKFTKKVARLHIPRVTQSTAGLYECRGVVGGVKTVVGRTWVEVLELVPCKGCSNKDRQVVLPTITDIMVQAGENARLDCEIEV
jgi:hypothetical protein